MESWQSRVVKFGFQVGRQSLHIDYTDLAEARIELDRIAAPLSRWTDLRMDRVAVEGIPAEWVYPEGVPEGRVVLYLHGGGYCVGSIVTHRVLAGTIARASAARALVLDYRLAPEHPFPAAVEDGTAAYRWLLSQGFPPERIVLAGDSAGGGLVLATLLVLRDAGDPLPRAAICLSPWIDLAMTGASIAERADIDPVLRVEALRVFAEHYLSGIDARHPLASPLYADLSGLPRMLIQVGTDEVLFDDAARLADRARAAGVDVTLDVWEGMVHVWQAYATFLPEGKEAIERIGAYIVRLVPPASPSSA